MARVSVDDAAEADKIFWYADGGSCGTSPCEFIEENAVYRYIGRLKNLKKFTFTS